jgi:hypothetical protein
MMVYGRANALQAVVSNFVDFQLRAFPTWCIYNFVKVPKSSMPAKIAKP